MQNDVDLTAKGTPFWVEDGGDHFYTITINDEGSFAELSKCEDVECDCHAQAERLAVTITRKE